MTFKPDTMSHPIPAMKFTLSFLKEKASAIVWYLNRFLFQKKDHRTSRQKSSMDYHTHSLTREICQVEPNHMKSLAKRLCPSCLRLSTSEIATGKILYFRAASLPNQPGCNLCEFIHEVYAEFWMQSFSFLQFNTNLQKTSVVHAFRVEILEKLNPAPEHLPSDIFVYGVRISDTWYGNSIRRDLFFKDLPSIQYHNPGEPDIPGHDSTPHGVVSKWVDMVRVRYWVHECLLKHSDCYSIMSGISESISLHAATRFIDVKLRRLVQMDEIFLADPFQYVALSYVWGQDYQLRTLSSNLALFRVKLPMSDAGPDGRLPKTIEDAIVVTRALRFWFLWVDALCIIQDSDRDLNLQLSQMDAIYGLAVMTITARSSNSSDSGLIGVSIPRLIGKADPEIAINGVSSVGIWDMDSRQNLEEKEGKLADPRYYMRRGWTFQEQILSTRSLEFNLDRAGFFCGRRESCQDRGYKEYASTDMYNPHHFRNGLRRYLRRDVIDLGPNPKGIANESWLMARWNTMRTVYSTRSLTYYVDRKRAILGTAKIMNNMVGGISSDGIMTNNLQEEVVWYLDTKEQSGITFSPDRATPGLFPSWSWLNLWPVTWPALCEPLPGISIRVLSDTEISNTPVLEIEAPMLELRLAGSSDGKAQLAYTNGNRIDMKLRLDSPIETGLLITCVPLVRGITIMWWEHELLLLHREGPYYTRIGIGCMREDDSKDSNSSFNLKCQRKRIVCL